MASIQTYNQTLDRRKAAHLIRRMSVGYDKAQIDLLEGMNSSAAVDYLLSLATVTPTPPVDTADTTFHEREELTNGVNSAIYRLYFRNWWLKTMIEATNPIQEKMVLFLNTHFTTQETKVGVAFPLYHQLELFRTFALGNFKTLSKKMCFDPAMSVFLDGWTNSAQDPNENFAREFFELYTIGKGEQVGPGDYTTYTEDDIREAAKVLTGYIPWCVIPDASIPAGFAAETDAQTGLYKSSIVPFAHDATTKTFSAAFQNMSMNGGGNTEVEIEQELDSFLDMIFNQEATAKNICRKLYRFFVYYDITTEIENDIISPLATTFINNNYELIPVLDQLFKSQHFYDADDSVTSNDNIGAVVKSPVELVANAFRYLDINVGNSGNWVAHHEALSVLSGALEQMDMPLYSPSEVAGFPAYHQAPSYNRNWISGSTLIQRYASFELLVFGVNLGNIELKLDTVDFVRYNGAISNPNDPNEIVNVLTNDLFPNGVNNTKFEALKSSLTDGDPDSVWSDAWDDYINSSNDLVIRLRLNDLFNSILQSPEFQLA